MDVQLPEAEPILGAYIEREGQGRTLEDAVREARPLLGVGLCAGILIGLLAGLGAGSATFFGFTLVVLVREMALATREPREDDATRA